MCLNLNAAWINIAHALCVFVEPTSGWVAVKEREREKASEDYLNSSAAALSNGCARSRRVWKLFEQKQILYKFSTNGERLRRPFTDVIFRWELRSWVMKSVKWSDISKKYSLRGRAALTCESHPTTWVCTAPQWRVPLRESRWIIFVKIQ